MHNLHNFSVLHVYLMDLVVVVAAAAFFVCSCVKRRMFTHRITRINISHRYLISDHFNIYIKMLNSGKWVLSTTWRPVEIISRTPFMRNKLRISPHMISMGDVSCEPCTDMHKHDSKAIDWLKGYLKWWPMIRVGVFNRPEHKQQDSNLSYHRRANVHFQTFDENERTKKNAIKSPR